MISKYGVLSVYGFLLGLCSLASLPMSRGGGSSLSAYLEDLNSNQTCLVLFAAYSAVAVVVLRVLCSGIVFKIYSQALILGLAMSAGALVSLLAHASWTPFGWYICVMAAFHYSEFFSIAVCSPKSLTPSSFMLNHSVPYGIAAATSWLEYLFWHYFLPDMKTMHKISYVGLFICAFGEVVRKSAIWTARGNFTHLVQEEKTQTHELITHGIYSWFRHPSYVGWFYWSIGTQVIMINPVCVVVYALASWKFFKDRIYYEEITLLNFFEEDYISYQNEVGIGLPFIKGFVGADDK